MNEFDSSSSLPNLLAAGALLMMKRLTENLKRPGRGQPEDLLLSPLRFTGLFCYIYLRGG